jgi:hypothetical protein
MDGLMRKNVYWILIWLIPVMEEIQNVEKNYFWTDIFFEHAIDYYNLRLEKKVCLSYIKCNLNLPFSFMI